MYFHNKKLLKNGEITKLTYTFFKPLLNSAKPLSDSFYPMTTYKVIANYELQKSNREKSIANHETVISNLEITFNMVGKEINIITDEIQTHKKGV